jgi:hypothetical protein
MKSNFGINHLGKVDYESRAMLVGLLAAEGVPTCFEEKTLERLVAVRRGRAERWSGTDARMPQLYVDAEKDIRANLDGLLGKGEVFDRWMEARRDAACALGVDMLRTIKKYLGVDAARIVVEDFRKLLVVYNAAARHANQAGDPRFVFDEELAHRVAAYTGR